jgi:hypothetical protein
MEPERRTNDDALHLKSTIFEASIIYFVAIGGSHVPQKKPSGVT